MIPSLWAGLHGWLLPGPPFLPGAPWPWDVMQLGIFWMHVWLDENVDAAVSCIHLGAWQFWWICQGILSSSHQWIWCTWASVFLLWVVLPLLLPEWVLWPVGLLSGWVVPTAQFTWTTANLSHAGRPRRAGPGVSAMYQYEWIIVVGLQECLVAREWGHRGFHTEESETHCRWLAWVIQGPGQWAGHQGWCVLDAAVGTDRGVVCYLQTQCQSWHGLRQCLYCWCLQAVLWLCMLHCTTGNWCCQWSFPLGACLLLFHNPLQQWTGLCAGVFSLFWLWQLVILSPFCNLWTGLDDGTLAD